MTDSEPIMADVDIKVVEVAASKAAHEAAVEAAKAEKCGRERGGLEAEMAVAKDVVAGEKEMKVCAEQDVLSDELKLLKEAQVAELAAVEKAEQETNAVRLAMLVAEKARNEAERHVVMADVETADVATAPVATVAVVEGAVAETTMAATAAVTTTG